MGSHLVERLVAKQEKQACDRHRFRSGSVGYFIERMYATKSSIAARDNSKFGIVGCGVFSHPRREESETSGRRAMLAKLGAVSRAIAVVASTVWQLAHHCRARARPWSISAACAAA
jgi:hypothetical protein